MIHVESSMSGPLSPWLRAAQPLACLLPAVAGTRPALWRAFGFPPGLLT